MVTVSGVGEDRLVTAVLQRLGTTATAGVVVGPGDDAAVLAGGGRPALSTDTLVQGVDFRLDWSAAGDVGAKAAAATLADVAAMGAPPGGLLLSLTLPPDTDVTWVLDLADGVAEECARAGAAVLGGDVAAGREVVVTGTAVGWLPAGRQPLLRSGARPGDAVAVAGVLGDSAAGLALLRRHGPAAAGTGAARTVVDRHRRPRVPYEAAVAAAAVPATSLIDVSDGLVRDARRVASASGVVLDLDGGALAPSDAAATVAGELGVDATSWVLTGGEDHAMLATFAGGAPVPEPFRVVGRAMAPDRQLDGPRPPGTVTVSGRPVPGPGGFTHFTP